MAEPAVARFCSQCGARLVMQDERGEARLACPAPGCGYVHYDNPVPVVGVIVEIAGHVVLARSHAWPEKMFGLMTGFLEAGEDPRACAVREVKEESGLDCEITHLVGLYAFEMQNQLIIVYHATARGTPQPSDEIAEFKLVPREKLRPWPVGTGLGVEAWIAAGRRAS